MTKFQVNLWRPGIIDARARYRAAARRLSNTLPDHTCSAALSRPLLGFASRRNSGCSETLNSSVQIRWSNSGIYLLGVIQCEWDLLCTRTSHCADWQLGTDVVEQRNVSHLKGPGSPLPFSDNTSGPVLKRVKHSLIFRDNLSGPFPRAKQFHVVRKHIGHFIKGQKFYEEDWWPWNCTDFQKFVHIYLLCLRNATKEPLNSSFLSLQLIFNSGIFFLPEDGTFVAETHLKNAPFIFVLIKTLNVFGVINGVLLILLFIP